jgi:hypothetical protein
LARNLSYFRATSAPEPATAELMAKVRGAAGGCML